MKNKLGAILGLIALILGVSLWIVLIFFNPYANSTNSLIITSISTMLLPALIALFAVIKCNHILMLGSFLLSLPINLYLMGTPGIFKFIIVCSFFYLLSGVILFSNKSI
jgi:hypothetical protein